MKNKDLENILDVNSRNENTGGGTDKDRNEGKVETWKDKSP